MNARLCTEALASKVQQHFGAATVATSPAAAAAAAAKPAPAVDINTRLKQLTTKAPVMLFMKGTKAWRRGGVGEVSFLLFFFGWPEKCYFFCVPLTSLPRPKKNHLHGLPQIQREQRKQQCQRHAEIYCYTTHESLALHIA